MTTTIAIDPSLRLTGVAVFYGTVLTRAFLIKNPSSARGAEGWRAMARAVFDGLGEVPFSCRTLVIETQDRHFRGRLADIFELAHATGAIVGALYADEYVTVTVGDWKGSLSKRISNRRAVRKLSSDECDAIEGFTPAVDGKLDSLPEGAEIRNVLDAIGIGLFHLKKTGVRK